MKLAFGLARMHDMKIDDNMSFEDALAELSEIVKNQASGKTKLADAVTVYERGVALKEYCEKKLSEAKMKIEQISLVNGEVKLANVPFDEGVSDE